MQLYDTNLAGHWDAMSSASLTKDDLGKVSVWQDLKEKYDVKADAAHQPKYVENAINGFPAIDFSGSAIGLVSDVKFSKGPDSPFTWIMAVQPRETNEWHNIFSTSDANWAGLGKSYSYYPISAASDGIHGWSTPSDVRDLELSVDQLTIYTIWYDGTNAKIYWGKDLKATNTPSNWNKGPTGYVAMGLGLQNRGHDYSGYIGEVLVYDVALESEQLNETIDAMTKKWTTGASWKKPGKFKMS